MLLLFVSALRWLWLAQIQVVDPVFFENHIVSSNKLFLPYFLDKIQNASRFLLHSLYQELIADHLDEFAISWSRVPIYPYPFDLMKYIPIDPGGCPRDTYRRLMANASISPPLPSNFSKTRVIAFILLCTSNTSALHRFIHFVNDTDFVFFILFDAKAGSMKTLIKIRYRENPNVFFVKPTITNWWGDYTLVESLLIALSAVVKTGIKFQWVSFHSGADLALRSGPILKQFLSLHVKHMHLCPTPVPGSSWFSRTKWPFFSAHPSCMDRGTILGIADGLKHVFPLWTQITAKQMAKSSQWFTLNFAVIRKIVEDVIRDDDFILRVLYTYIADECFTSNYLKKLGFAGWPRCDLRYIEWNYTTGRKIGLKHIKWLVNGPWLFARKMYDDDKVWNMFLKEAKKLEADGKLPHFLRNVCQS
jgi:hypothetical protein